MEKKKILKRKKKIEEGYGEKERERERERDKRQRLVKVLAAGTYTLGQLLRRLN